MPIQLTERFVRQYGKLPPAIRKKVDRVLRQLDADFRHPGLRSHPVESAPGIFEAYVDGRYRMTFQRQGNTFIMRNVDNHDRCLRDP